MTRVRTPYAHLQPRWRGGDVAEGPGGEQLESRARQAGPCCSGCPTSRATCRSPSPTSRARTPIWATRRARRSTTVSRSSSRGIASAEPTADDETARHRRRRRQAELHEGCTGAARARSARTGGADPVAYRSALRRADVGPVLPRPRDAEAGDQPRSRFRFARAADRGRDGAFRSRVGARTAPASGGGRGGRRELDDRLRVGGRESRHSCSRTSRPACARSTAGCPKS
jgi:hypothetical protein